MPDRFVRDSIKTSTSLAALSDRAERLFWRLVTCADDFGRFHSDSRIIFGMCFALFPAAGGWTPESIETLLQELSTVIGEGDVEPIIRLYEAQGKRFGYFTRWSAHQRQRASKSKYPPPMDQSCRPTTVADDRRGALGFAPHTHSDLDPDPDLFGREDLGKKEKKGEIESFSLTPARAQYAARKGVDAPAAFARFTSHYRANGGRQSNGRKIVDFDAAWENWVRNAVDRKQDMIGSGSKLSTGMENLKNIHDKMARENADDGKHGRGQSSGKGQSQLVSAADRRSGG